MDLDKRLQAFVALGTALRAAFGDEGITEPSPKQVEKIKALENEAAHAKNYNGWFVEKMVRNALLALGKSLREEKLKKWVSAYDMETVRKEKVVGVVMAGNVPAVGFHDFLSVLISGHKLLARLSSDDSKLLPAIADLLLAQEAEFKSYITFTEGRLQDFDAVIATGSNNTSRYFEYYFGKYPHIIRKNRNGIAILTGEESQSELEALADDIFLYYGLGCRNVSKIFVPKGYGFNPLLAVLEKRHKIAGNHKYFNNYEYNKAIFLINGRRHLDTGNILLVEDTQLPSPVGVLHYEYYSSDEALSELLMTRKDKIQCIMSGAKFLPKTVSLGGSQQPELWDYADGVDTLDFLLKL